MTRLKIMGDMDIAEKRIPQDGRIQTTFNGMPVDLRLSVLPTVNGEKIVIRILGGRGVALDRKKLGFNERNSGLFDEILKNPNGIILVSGPTGSGKSTTLYTVLKEINKPGINIITVEDPVEYYMSGVNQVQVNPKAGLSFASGLRAILRQDPDVIMIGEIRDAETAKSPSGVDNRTPCFVNNPHKRFRLHRNAAYRHGNRALSCRRLSGRGHIPEAGAQDLRKVQAGENHRPHGNEAAQAERARPDI